jgi:hypothetical protein
MLAQLHLSEKERWAVTEYLKAFSQRFKAEKTPEPIAIPSQPSANTELIAFGKGCIWTRAVPNVTVLKAKETARQQKTLKTIGAIPYCRRI